MISESDVDDEIYADDFADIYDVTDNDVDNGHNNNYFEDT